MFESRRRLAILAGLVVTMLALAMPERGAAAEPPCPVSEIRIVVLGDSLADGLWGAYQRRFARCATVEVVRLTTVSDGLAKTSSNEWLARFEGAARRAGNTPTIAIVQIGANDITTIRQGRQRESFATEAWNALYARRVGHLVQGLRQRSVQVAWFGLPVVGKDRLEPGYQAITALQRAAARRAGADFIDVHRPTMFGTGAFAMNGVYRGRTQQLRAPDQIHFTRAGYDFVADQYVGKLSGVIAETDRRAGLNVIDLQ